MNLTKANSLYHSLLHSFNLWFNNHGLKYRNLVTVNLNIVTYFLLISQIVLELVLQQLSVFRQHMFFFVVKCANTVFSSFRPRRIKLDRFLPDL